MSNELLYSGKTIIHDGAMSPMDIWLTRKRAENARAISKVECAATRGLAVSPLIVVVDDEPAIAITLAEILSRKELPAVWFTDPREALQFIASASVSVLLSDITMPHLDGLALAQGTHELQPTCALFLFSGLAGDKDVQDRIETMGLPIYLAAKPLCPRRMVETVRSLISDSPVPEKQIRAPLFAPLS